MLFCKQQLKLPLNGRYLNPNNNVKKFHFVNNTSNFIRKNEFYKNYSTFTHYNVKKLISISQQMNLLLTTINNKNKFKKIEN